MLNHIVLQGRLVREPEMRRTQSGTAVCTFTLAVERDVAAQDGVRKVDFIDCVAWRGAAEHVCKHYHKGSAAVVSGRLELRDWTDKEGNKRRSAEVIVGSIYFGESKKSASASASNSGAAAYASGTADFSIDTEFDDGDLPF